MNIVDLIFERHHGPEMAVISTDGSLSYAGLHARVLETEHALRRDASWPSHAHRPRIGLHAPSGPDYIVLALAILKAGACFVPIPSEQRRRQQRVRENGQADRGHRPRWQALLQRGNAPEA